MFVNTLLKYWTYRLFAPGVILRETYDAFRELLVFDSRSHELMAELEGLYYQGKKEDFCRIAERYNALSTSVSGMVESLERMAPGSFVTLREYYRKFDFYSRFLLAPPALRFGPPFVLNLTDPLVNSQLSGGKCANLAELARALHLPVPGGFVITVNSFYYLLEYNDLRSTINTLLTQVDLTLPETLAQTSEELMRLINHAEIPPDIHEAILNTYAGLNATDRTNELLVAVRSSAVNEDGDCSFAGQYATILDVKKDNLLTAYLAVLASKYTPEALAYRIHSGLSDDETPMAVLILEMVDSLASGVIYTIDPADQKMEDTTHLFIHAVRGQGEALVSGRIIPEVLIVEKQDSSNFRLDTSNPAASHPAGALSASQISQLADAALKLESHFESPQDIEWAMSQAGEIFYLQSRPLHRQSLSMDEDNQAASARIKAIKDVPLCQGGTMAALGQACGPAYCVDAAHPVELMPAGSILVVNETLPSYVQVLQQVKGVLAGLGSIAGHFSTVCREFGIPLLCGLGTQIKAIEHGRIITMDAEGMLVYHGDLLPHLATIPHHESQKHLPFYRKLRKLLNSITPLHLIDPKAKGFTPESCRSLHDIIRFSHEQAVRTMFSLGDRLGNRNKNRKKLLSDLPFDIFVVDVGGGLEESVAREEFVSLEQITSVPFQALWAGMTHPSVQWPDRLHFDWKHFGEMTMADGISSSDSSDLASYAVLGADYVNLIMRFGYHFTLVDALCGEDNSNNYCQFRFAGGGADYAGRLLRLEFISTLLQEDGFQVVTKGDLLDARIAGLNALEMQDHLLVLGRLLGATKLMDMALHDKQDVQKYVQDFLRATKEQ